MVIRMESSEPCTVKGKGKGKGKGKKSSKENVVEVDILKETKPLDSDERTNISEDTLSFDTEKTVFSPSLDLRVKPSIQFDMKLNTNTEFNPRFSPNKNLDLNIRNQDTVDNIDCDPIDLSNPSRCKLETIGFRHSVIVKNSISDLNKRPDVSIKNIESARKILFFTGPNSLSKERNNEQWNSWRSNQEIECNLTDSPSNRLINNASKDERIYEDKDSLIESNTEISRMSRKRLLATPKFTLAKKSCSEDVSSAVLTPEENIVYPPELNQWLETYDSWSNSDKALAADSLISRSSIIVVRHMKNTIEPLFQTDFISDLPTEIALIILAYLDPEDLAKVAQTCRYWRVLANDNLLWKKLCLNAGINFVRPTVFNLASTSKWKSTYANQHVIERNWRTKSAADAIIMRGHDEHVITCLQCYGNKIVSGSDDTTLKVWSTITGECLQTLVGHAGGVWSCQMIEDTIVSGSTDRTLRVWNAITGKCTSVLGGHTSTVRCMRMYKNTVVSGSRDATLRVWQLSQGRCLQVLVGHMAAVRCVQFNGKLVVSGAYDFSVKVWNPKTGECLHTLTGHTNRVYTLKFDGVHIVSGSLDTTIRVWDAATGQLKHTLIGHTSLITSMELQDNTLVSGNADSTLKVWDINTGQCIHTLAGLKKHQLSVTYVQLLKRFVVSSSDDGTVKLWDLKTGEFIRNIVHLASGGSGGNVLRIRATNTQLVCAVGSRNGTEETKLMLMKFDRHNQRRIVSTDFAWDGQKSDALLKIS